MPDNDGRTDGEPQPLAGHVRSRRRAPAEEGLEDPLPVFGRYARPRVLHAELQPVAHANASADPDGTRRWRVLGRVLEQIGQHALHPIGIDADRRQSGRDVDAHQATAEQTANPVEPALDERCRTREHPVCHRRPRTSGATGSSQRVHELGEPTCLDLDLGEKVAPCRRVPVHVGPAQAADEALDVAQRQAKLVGQHRWKFGRQAAVGPSRSRPDCCRQAWPRGAATESHGLPHVFGRAPGRSSRARSVANARSAPGLALVRSAPGPRQEVDVRAGIGNPFVWRVVMPTPYGRCRGGASPEGGPRGWNLHPVATGCGRPRCYRACHHPGPGAMSRARPATGASRARGRVQSPRCGCPRRACRGCGSRAS